MKHMKQFYCKTCYVLLVITVVGLIWCGCCSLPPSSYKQANGHREGIVQHKVAIVYSSNYRISLGGLEKLHPHPQNYEHIYLHLQTDGYIKPADVFVPAPATPEQIALVHSKAHAESLSQSRNIATYLEAPMLSAIPAGALNSGVLQSFRHQCGGTIKAAELANEHGIGINLGGGFHHAKRDVGEGFCVYNDLAIAIRAMQKTGEVTRVLVVDLDVHQGNGTAEIFAGDDSVYTFSMHQGNIYPIPKAKSDLDIELAEGATDADFMRQLKTHLPELLDTSQSEMVFYQAGADVLAADPLGSLKVSQKGMVARDAYVLAECVKRGIPVVYTLGGGYSNAAWKAQLASIEQILKTYGLCKNGPIYPPRDPTIKEKLYTK